LLLFVIFEFGFVGAALVFAESILHALTWLSVLVGNLLAAAAMTAYFWRQHADLRISP
jgi:amino acid permease